MDIDKELKKESETFRIRTSSQKILSAYQAKPSSERKPASKNHWWIPVSGGLVFACTAVAICAVVFTTKPSSSFQPILEEELPLDDASLVGQTGLQLFYGSQFAPKNQTNSNTKRSISINVPDVQARVRKNYDGLYATIHSFFGTGNKLVVRYGKTDFTYEGEKYPYVLIQGDSKVYTKEDIRNGQNENIAVYQMSDKTYKGYIYCDSDEDLKLVRSVFYSTDKKITIAQGSDEDGTGLFCRISYRTQDVKESESYLISMEFSKGTSDFDRCFMAHRTGLSLVKATTEYDDRKQQYHVDYLDIVASDLSGIHTEFTYTVNVDGSLSYHFSE